MTTPTDAAKGTASYFICATPRTGSSLLLGLLNSTGVAGHPQAYFREPDEPKWAEQWQLPRTPDGAFDYAEYVRAALAAGCSDNDVFGAKLMWGAPDALITKLGTIRPDLAGDPKALLESTFRHVRFVHLRRDDVLAQAVSWVRAEQTDAWYIGGDGEIGGTGATGRVPSYDADRIAHLIQVIEEHNAGWDRWFAAVDVQPYRARYEDLASDMVGVTRRILSFLAIDLPAGRAITPHHQRQADELNDQWIDRYRHDAHALPTRPGRCVRP